MRNILAANGQTAQGDTDENSLTHYDNLNL